MHGATLIEMGFAGAVTGIGSLVAWYLRKLYKNKEDKSEKVDELYQAVFGMDNVGTMEGVVEIIDTHEDDIEQHEERLDDAEDEIGDLKERVSAIAERREEVDSKVQELKEKVENRTKKADAYDT